MPSHERMSELVHLAKTKQSTLACRLLDMCHELTMSRANVSSVTRLTNEKDVPEMNWLNACAPDSPAVKGEQEPGESRLKNNWIVPILRPFL
jgi:hypothetical protein